MSNILRILAGVLVIVTAFIVKGRVTPASGEGAADPGAVSIWGITTTPTMINVVIGLAIAIGAVIAIIGIVGALRNPSR